MPPRRQIATTADEPTTHRAGPSQSSRPPSRAGGRGPDMVESKAKTPRPPSKIKKEAQLEAVVESISQDVNRLVNLVEETRKKAEKKEQDRNVVGESSKAMPRGPQK